jgi:hypothetical protein
MHCRDRISRRKMKGGSVHGVSWAAALFMAVSLLFVAATLEARGGAAGGRARRWEARSRCAGARARTGTGAAALGRGSGGGAPGFLGARQGGLGQRQQEGGDATQGKRAGAHGAALPGDAGHQGRCRRRRRGAGRRRRIGVDAQGRSSRTIGGVDVGEATACRE